MGTLGSTREMSRATLQLTEGLFAHAVDMALWFTAYMGEISLPQPVRGQVWRAGKAADNFLDEVNYKVIKNALYTAKRRGWVKTKKRNAPPQITAEGKRRLSAIVPQFDERRAWDGRLHLVTYDIPEKRRNDRDMLRIFLRRIGCGKLQDSVWITPYNPIDTLQLFIDKKQLKGSIIISDLGQDASIGEEDIRALLVRVYDLEKLNAHYEEWLSKTTTINHYALIQFLAILADDPQLPFALLPPWWKGNEAHERVKKLLERLSIHSRP